MCHAQKRRLQERNDEQEALLLLTVVSSSPYIESDFEQSAAVHRVGWAAGPICCRLLDLIVISRYQETSYP
jgi:hypothetical protein